MWKVDGVGFASIKSAEMALLSSVVRNNERRPHFSPKISRRSGVPAGCGTTWIQLLHSEVKIPENCLPRQSGGSML